MEVDVSIQRHFAGTNCPIDDRTWVSWFSLWLEKMQTILPPAQGYELSLMLTSDGEIQAMNAQYRQKNQPTDVLAFAALEVDFPQYNELHPVILGDIVISVETAARQAQQQRHSLSYELAWLAAHGFLHLLGWDHPDEEHLTRMLEQQEMLLQKALIARNVIPDGMTVQL
ncbi:MAG: rRNA maturation RNase YbeY [Hormoscilla sp. GM7CHS1pb]|nr:rRNA maturation RNase YbeY [Hormoscilla sp. GM7CHS1pb]